MDSTFEQFTELMEEHDIDEAGFLTWFDAHKGDGGGLWLKETGEEPGEEHDIPLHVVLQRMFEFDKFPSAVLLAVLEAWPDGAKVKTAEYFFLGEMTPLHTVLRYFLTKDYDGDDDDDDATPQTDASLVRAFLDAWSV